MTYRLGSDRGSLFLVLMRELAHCLREYRRQYVYRQRCGEDSMIGRNVKLSEDTVVGDGCRIQDDVILDSGVRLYSGVEVRQFSRVKRVSIGEQSVLDRNVLMTGSGDGRIVIGTQSYVGMYNVLDYSADIAIGDYVHISGPSTAIWTHSSAGMCIRGVPLAELYTTGERPRAAVTVNSNVYIGGNCTIYPGVTIGHHSIIAPNSAVTSDVEPWSLVGGVPARLIRRVSLD